VKFNQVSSGSLKNLSFSIKVGEIVLIIDKSNTVLDIVSALIQQESTPYSGIIDLPSSMSNNKKLSNNIIERNPIHTVLFPELSYIENLCFLLAEKIPYFWQKKHLAKSVIREYRPILGDVILEPNLYHMTNKELYTLLYYRYIITRPDLVVCIQPLSGADMYLRTHILKLIIKMRNNDIAVLILDTELYDTLNIVDRLIQIESGKITSEHNRTNFNVNRDMNEQLLTD
jgi:ribose transport system ATP-binding protein